MKVSDKTLTFDKTLWVHFDGVDVKETGGEVKLTARDEESYLKVLNHFGRVLKLFIFEDGKWVDSDTGLAAKPFDESQAGRLPETAAGTKKKTPVEKNPVEKTPVKKKPVKSKAGKKKAAEKTAAPKKTAPKKTAAKKAKATPAGGKSGGKAKTPK